MGNSPDVASVEQGRDGRVQASFPTENRCLSINFHYFVQAQLFSFIVLQVVPWDLSKFRELGGQELEPISQL